MVDVDKLLDIVKEKTGVSEDKAKLLLGSFFSYAKKHGISVLPAQLESFVAKAEKENEETKSAGGYPEGNLLESGLGFVEKLTNDDEGKTRDGESAAASAAASTPGEVDSVTELLALLKKAGIEPEKVMSVLPSIIDFLKKNGIDVESLMKKIPGAATSSTTSSNEAKDGEETTEQVVDEVKEAASGLLNKASGFLGGFGK